MWFLLLRNQKNGLTHYPTANTLSNGYSHYAMTAPLKSKINCWEILKKIEKTPKTVAKSKKLRWEIEFLVIVEKFKKNLWQIQNIARGTTELY